MEKSHVKIKYLNGDGDDIFDAHITKNTYGVATIESEGETRYVNMASVRFISERTWIEQ